MASIKNLRAAKKFGPGYFIKEQMEIRGWVQEELAEILGISPKHLSSILQDRQALSIDNAKKLSAAFNTSAQYWLNLDRDYRLWLQEKEQQQTNTVQDKAMIYSRMPVRDMMKKGWLSKTRNLDELIEEVKQYWEISRLDFQFLDDSFSLYCKKSEAYNQYKASYTVTWFQMAKKVSRNYHVASYDSSSLEALFQRISTFTTKENGIAEFLQALNACGVKFFVLPHLEKTYLDGAAFFHDAKPVVVCTLRYARTDNFWFTIAHEIAHLLRHLSEENSFILDNLNEKSTDRQEEEANLLAAQQLKHPEILEMLERHVNYLTSSRIESSAEKLNIHPAIIVGALAFNELISYQKANLLHKKLNYSHTSVLELIPEKFLYNPAYLN